jgi:APA family basic amino acid/polyamine antiporter
VNTWVTGLLVALSCNVLTPGQAIGLCNIGTLFAFILVSIGVIVLRRREPDRRARSRCRAIRSRRSSRPLACFGLILGLELSNWLRLAIWLQIGLFPGFFYVLRDLRVQEQVSSCWRKLSWGGRVVCQDDANR